MCFSLMASGFTINSFAYSASSRTEYSFRMDTYNSLPKEISFGDRSWYNGLQSSFKQPFGNEHNGFQGSHLVYQQPFGNERIAYQDPWYMHPDTASIKEEKTNPTCYHSNGNEPNEDWSQNSYSCFYKKEHFKTEGLLEQINLSFKLPSDYYQGTYPLNIQLPDVIPNINIDIFLDNQKFSECINEATEDAYLINKLNENETSAIQVLDQLIPQPSEIKRNDNHHLDSNNRQTSENKFFMPESFYPHYSGSDINENTHFQHETSSGRNFYPITNMNFTSATMESNSNERLNSSSSESSKYESDETDHSMPETVSNFDNTIIKDFPLSKLHQSTNIFVKTEGLHSPVKIIREKLHMGHNLDPTHKGSNFEASKIQKFDTILSHLLQSEDQNLYPSFYQASNTEANDIQKSDTKTSHLLQSEDQNLYPSFYQASNTEANEIQKSDTTISHRLQSEDQNLYPSSYQASNTEANEIQKLDSMIRHLQPSNSYKHRPKFSRDHPRHQKEFKKTDSIALAKKCSKKDSRTIQVASKKGRGSNSYAISGDKFVNIEDLEMLLKNLSKFDVHGHQGLNPDFTMDVNIYIVGLGDCDTTRLFNIFAKKKIDGMAFVKKLKTFGITLKFKTWLLQYSESSFNLKNFPEFSRNVIVAVYNVTETFDVYAIRHKIECLKLAKLPILLVGNTSETTAMPPKIRLVPYRAGYRMKKIYKLSLFFECSFDSSVEVDSLFITAVDSAFRFSL